MLTTEVIQGTNSVYESYNNLIKPLIADIEAKYEKISPELLNEIRATFDHIARCYLPGRSGDEIDKDIEKANGHIIRLALDCYKCLNVYYHKSFEKFEKKTERVDLSRVDNGDFYAKYRQFINTAKLRIREAKKKESTDKSAALRLFEEAYTTYGELDEFITSRYGHIQWAKRWYSGKRVLRIILWLLAAIISGFVSVFLSCDALKEFVNSWARQSLN